MDDENKKDSSRRSGQEITARDCVVNISEKY